MPNNGTAMRKDVRLFEELSPFEIIDPAGLFSLRSARYPLSS
jgi:hypothetical protein